MIDIKTMSRKETIRALRACGANGETCGECMYCDEDESWTEDDYFWFSYCTIGLGPEDGISTDTPACNCFRPL